MGFRRALRLARAVQETPKVPNGFSMSMGGSSDGFAFELDAPAELLALWGIGTGDYVPPATEAQALSVPAVKRGRDLICGTIGGWPLVAMNTKRDRVPNMLLEQPEEDFARSVTMAKTVQDMLFHERAWWRVLKLDAKTKFPARVRRLDARSVLVREDAKVYYAHDGNVQGQAMEQVPDKQLIRIEAPNPGILRHGARAIRQALDLDKAAAQATKEPAPQGVFTPKEGVDPGDEAEVRAMVNRWAAGRSQSSWGYVGAALDLAAMGFSPEQLQLADQRQHAVLELARLMGVDPEDLGVSTTSRTYQNGEQRRLDLIDFTLAAYVNAIQDRLSMNDVMPPGHVARFDFSRFLRADTKTRMETYDVGRRVGAYDDERIAEAEELPVARVKAATESAKSAAPAATPEAADAARPPVEEPAA